MTRTVAGDVLQVLLDHEAGRYVVRFAEGPSRARVLDLFGADAVPLPWRSSTPPESIVAELRLLHPDAEVIVP